MNDPQPPLSIAKMYTGYDPYNYEASHHLAPRDGLKSLSDQPLGVQDTGPGEDPYKEFSEALYKSLSKRDQIVIVHGAPGTGKTEFLAAVIELYADLGYKTIVITPNNSTVSCLVRRAFHRRTTNILITSPSNEKASENINFYTVEHFLHSRRNNSFTPSHCVIDDASHVKMAHVFPLLLHCEKVIMAGDPKQFRLLHSDNRELLGDNVMQLRNLKPVVFHYHRRSNEEIFEWSLKRNYPETVLKQDEKLKSIPDKQQNCLKPVMMLDTSLDDKTDFCESFVYGMEQDHGYYNDGEVIVVERHVNNLLENYSISDDDIAVITTTSAQVGLLKQKLNCKVGLLEDFQGREFKVIIFSAVKRNPFRYFADLTLKRLEYIMSRAICHFAYVGCAFMMLNDELNSIIRQWKNEKCRFNPVTYEVDTSCIINPFKLYPYMLHEFIENCHEYVKICRIRNQEPDHVVRKFVSSLAGHLSPTEQRLFKFEADGYYHLEFINRNSDGLNFKFFTERQGTIILGQPVILLSIDDRSSQTQRTRLSGVCYPGRTLSTTCFVPDFNQMEIQVNNETKYRIVPDDSQFEVTKNISFRTILLIDHFSQRLEGENNRHEVFYGKHEPTRSAHLVHYIADNFLDQKIVATAIDETALSVFYSDTEKYFEEKNLEINEVISEDELFERANLLDHADHVARNVEKWREQHMEGKLEFEALHQFTVGLVNNFYKLFARRIMNVISKTRVLFCAINSPFINLFSQIEKNCFDPDVCLICEASQINQMQVWPIAWTDKKILMTGELDVIPETTYLSIKDKAEKDALKKVFDKKISSLQNKSEKDSPEKESEEKIDSLQDNPAEESLITYLRSDRTYDLIWKNCNPYSVNGRIVNPLDEYPTRTNKGLSNRFAAKTSLFHDIKTLPIVTRFSS